MRNPSTIGPSGHVHAAKHVRYRHFDDDLVLVDLERGEYFALDPIGARMWDLLISGRTPAEVAALLAVEYEVTQTDILQDCTKLADDLLEHRLLVIRPNE